ncbi:MAG TPA: TrkA family potassium uptake protein [Chloroflexia bacterium]|nr:TrkA family potassium uptake protein [Chloroflexia bacterium]
MKIVIMGCGRVGTRLAQLFDREGHDVAVVDLHPEPFERLGAHFRGTTLVGTAIDEDVLRALGIETADLFLAVTNRDNANIMAAQIAKLTFRVPRVIARIYEPDREDTFHEMGLETICPTTLISNRIYEAVGSGSDAHMPSITPAARPAPVPLPAAAPVSVGANGAHQDDEHDDRHGSHLGHTLRQRFFR